MREREKGVGEPQACNRLAQLGSPLDSHSECIIALGHEVRHSTLSSSASSAPCV
jgi:hypothetical protein